MNKMRIQIEPVINTEPINQSSELQSVAPQPKVLRASQLEVSVSGQMVDLHQMFAEFLQLEVGDGAASPDTIRNYISHTKQYCNWCRDNLLQPLTADADDIKQYRKFLIEEKKKNKTIATKLNIIRRFYQAAVAKGLISANPVAGIKAPVSKEDPASRITYLTEAELSLLLREIQSQLEQAKTQKQKLPIIRDRVLIGIMSIEGTRTVELHNLQVKQIVRQGKKTGLRVFAKRASRIVPLTDTLSQQLEEYLTMRRKVLRRKIKPGDYVFVSVSNNSKGKQLSRRGIRAIVDRYLIATGLKHQEGRTLSAHSLRHTAGTQALRTGSDLRQVQDLLGHADPRTTSIYAHVGDRWENNPGANIENLLEKQRFKLSKSNSYS